MLFNEYTQERDRKRRHTADQCGDRRALYFQPGKRSDAADQQIVEQNIHQIADQIRGHRDLGIAAALLRRIDELVQTLKYQAYADDPEIDDRIRQIGLMRSGKTKKRLGKNTAESGQDQYGCRADNENVPQDPVGVYAVALTHASGDDGGRAGAERHDKAENHEFRLCGDPDGVYGKVAERADHDRIHDPDKRHEHGFHHRGAGHSQKAAVQNFFRRYFPCRPDTSQQRFYHKQFFDFPDHALRFLPFTGYTLRRYYSCFFSNLQEESGCGAITKAAAAP